MAYTMREYIAIKRMLVGVPIYSFKVFWELGSGKDNQVSNLEIIVGVIVSLVSFISVYKEMKEVTSLKSRVCNAVADVLLVAFFGITALFLSDVFSALCGNFPGFEPGSLLMWIGYAILTPCMVVGLQHYAKKIA